MTENPIPQPEREHRDPMQAALETFNAQIAAPVYDRDALRAALAGVQAASLRLNMNPAEVYSSLSTLSGELAITAQRHNETQDYESFIQQQGLYQQTSELFRQQLGGTTPDITSKPATSQPTPPSALRGRTGRAAG